MTAGCLKKLREMHFHTIDLVSETTHGATMKHLVCRFIETVSSGTGDYPAAFCIGRELKYRYGPCWNHEPRGGDDCFGVWLTRRNSTGELSVNMFVRHTMADTKAVKMSGRS